MLVPIFSLKLNHKINPRMVTVGCYDGQHANLTCGTTAGKVFIHSTVKSLSIGGRMEKKPEGDLCLLNINQTVTALKAGRLDPSLDRDVLVVGTQTNLLAYDVHQNKDLFYNDSPDGCNVIEIGKLGNIASTLAICGGNCSLQGYDMTGNDLFWTVTGDNVCSMALIDYTSDGQQELLVGSEDFDIRVFKEDEIISEINESETITGLCAVADSRFGYALVNGTVGVYDRTTRYWRIKSKNSAISLCAFDINGDGVPELITGWSSGKLDVRSDRTGEVILKDNFPHAVAGMIKADYKGDGKELLVACSIDGEVRGYHAESTKSNEAASDESLEQDTIRELSQRKQALLLELANYEANKQVGQDSAVSSHKPMGIIPANTQLQTSLLLKLGSENKDLPHIELYITTTNDTIIKAVVIFAEGIFNSESHVVHPLPTQVTSSFRIPLIPPKDAPIDLHVKAFVGVKNSDHFHVFELTRQLPRFSMYTFCTAPPEPFPIGHVNCIVNERINRVVLWINQSFLMKEDVQAEGSLSVTFLSLRGSGPLCITMDSKGEVNIKTDDMDLAGDIIQNLCSFLNIDDLQTTGDFPHEMNKLQDLLQKVDEYQSVRQKLTAELATFSGQIKALAVHAEDARIMDDMKMMRKRYMDLYYVNRDLLSGYKIRCNNHMELLACLKEVNQMIQRASRLRVGKHKTDMVNACRAAVKTNNMSALSKIMKTGTP